MEFDSIIVRFSGEIGIKSEWTRRAYEKQVLQNLKQTLKFADLKPDAIERIRGRIYLKTQKPNETAKALGKIFGITSVSPAKVTSSEFSDITKIALEMVKEIIKENTTFVVRSHRSGTHPYTSMDLCRDLGEKILEAYEQFDLKVDLFNPQVTVNVEVRDQQAYVYVQTLQGAKGFPVGTQAKIIGLLSGGIDSPVACWLTMKRGCPTIPVFVDNFPFTDEKTKQKAIETARILKQWSAGHIRKMYIVPNGENMKNILQKTPRRFTCLFCKRLMYLISENIAELENALGIVTGEAIGEQASQTLQNLYVIDEAAKAYPIHRPLLGFDKLEIEAFAKKIGTYEVSIVKTESCSAVPSMPSTMAKLSAIKDAEKELDMYAMAKTAVQAAQIIEI
ncbi:MAG: tRNA 4-thiouridine(8) synthase ThiI [Crenarchaeota archaeon]|nr:tRNA 4-thiouridine(8) synthase ThiI [Thermoproteota archaeon]